MPNDPQRVSTLMRRAEKWAPFDSSLKIEVDFFVHQHFRSIYNTVVLLSKLVWFSVFRGDA